MKSVLKRIMAFSSVFIFLFITGQVPNAFSSGENGVDSIRGQWNILVSGVESLQNSPLSIFVNDLVFRPESNDFVAAGCMETMVSGGIAPLSLRATPIGPNDFEVTILSTVEPTDNQPFVIRLIGTIRAYGSGLPDDTAGGNVFSQLSQTGSWEGYHKNRLCNEFT